MNPRRDCPSHFATSSVFEGDGPLAAEGDEMAMRRGARRRAMALVVGCFLLLLDGGVAFAGGQVTGRPGEATTCS